MSEGERKRKGGETEKEGMTMGRIDGRKNKRTREGMKVRRKEKRDRKKEE